MENDVLELYPHPGERHLLRELYLRQPLEPAEHPRETPFFYSNFISSLDGRIAIPGPGRDSHQVPPAISNDRDWRLFQELAARADLLITTGRYFRQMVGQEEQAELPVGSSPEFKDLRDWRTSQGMPAQPDVAVFSASLEIPVESIRHYANRTVYLLTGAKADANKLQRLAEATHAKPIVCGQGNNIDGSMLRGTLADLGYRRVYAIAGPAVLHTLVAGNALDRLYHTTAHCLLGGTRFDTFVRGPLLDPAFRMPLRAMYLDPHAPDGMGQTLAVYGQ
jgi:riboflavin biosynthesis pyrimidine reductase